MGLLFGNPKGGTAQKGGTTSSLLFGNKDPRRYEPIGYTAFSEEERKRQKRAKLVEEAEAANAEVSKNQANRQSTFSNLKKYAGAELKDTATSLWEGSKAGAERLGRGVARTLPGGTADLQAAEQEVTSQNTLRTQVIQRLRDKNLDPKQKRNFERLLDNLNQDKDPATALTETIAKVKDDADKSKFIGALIETASLFVGGGSLGAAAKAGRASLTKAVFGTAASGALGGGGYTAQQDDASIGDIAKGAGIGAAAGVGIGAGAAVAGKAFRSAKNFEMPSLADTTVGGAVSGNRAVRKTGDRLSGAVAKVVDDTNYVKKPFKGLKNPVTGEKITDEIEGLVTNVRQFSAKSQQRLQDNRAYQELVPLIGGSKKNYKDFGDFISAKQTAINRNKLIQSGKIKAKKMAVPAGTPEQERAYELLNKATKDDVQYLFDNGIIDDVKYKQWIDDPDYTRVQREVQEDLNKGFGGGGRLTSGTPVTNQKLKGSTKQALDPFASYEDWQRKVTLDVERNNLGRYLRDQSVRLGKSKQVDTTSQGYERLKQLYGEEGLRKEVLPVFEKGMKELYTIDPRAARQLASSTDLELKAVADWALLPGRLLKGGATTLNAAFAVPNFIRDQMSSAILSKKVWATHNPIAFLAGLKEAVIKPTANAALRKIPGVSDEVFAPTPLFREYLSKNANITSVDLARNLKKATRQAQENLGVKGESLLRRYENVISASEKLTRFQNFRGTYMNAIKNNVPVEEAIKRANQAARTNSINFSNRGEIATFAKIFNPYINASIQGSATLARAFRDRPVGTSLKIGVGLLGPVAGATYYNLSDPKRAEIYARIPDYERRDNLVFVLGGDQGYFKIPLPPGMREFANPLRNYVESEFLGDRQGFLETAKNIFIDPFSPVGTTGNELLSNAVPQAVKPVLELGLNRDLYTGNQIIPDNLQGLPADEQVFEKTAQSYRDVGKLLGVSPLQVRKVVAGYGAGGIEGALATLDVARGKESGKRSTVEQIIRRFYGDKPSDSSNQVKSTFYETYTPLRQRKDAISKKITSAVKAGDIGKANRLANEINDEIEREKQRLRESYGKFETDLTALYDQFDYLKFPVENGSLKQSSIKARQKQ